LRHELPCLPQGANHGAANRFACEPNVSFPEQGKQLLELENDSFQFLSTEVSAMRLLVVLGLGVSLGLLAGPTSSGQEGGQKTKAIRGLGPVGPIKKLYTDFKFTEGAAADKEGNVYFNDIPNSTTYKVDLEGKRSVFRTETNRANGQKVNSQGEVVACEMGSGRVVAVSPDGKKVRVLASKYNGKRFNAPNDVVLDRQDNAYFTDPTFGAPTPLPQGKAAVYFIPTKGEVTRLLDALPNPNGIILSPDGKTLYVIPSGQPEMMAYPVEAPGKIGKGRVFCKLKQAPNSKFVGGDGCTIDVKGNLYITSALGLQVFDAEGQLLGILEFPETPANVCFGGADGKTLFVTARTSLYTAPMEVQGFNPLR
jgi:gluconolactonase